MSCFASNQNNSSDFLSSIWPNTISLEASNQSMEVNLKDREPLIGKVKSLGGDQNSILKYINTLSLGHVNLENPKKGWSISMSYTLSYLLSRINFYSDSNFIQDTDFTLYRFSFGLGPEFKYFNDAHEYFFQVSPGAAYSYIVWSSPISGGSMGKYHFNLTELLGYRFHYNPNHFIQVSVRVIMESKAVWEMAFNESQGFQVPIENIFNSFSGISWNYQF